MDGHLRIAQKEYNFFMIPSPQNTPPSLPDCDAVGELLSAYLDGELTEGEKNTIEAHLQTCDACRQLAEALGNLRREIGGAELTPPPALHGAIMTKIHRENRLRRIRRLTAIGSAGVAAMLCFVILGNALLGTLTSADSAAPEANRKADMDAYSLNSPAEVMDFAVEAGFQRSGSGAPSDNIAPAGQSEAETVTTEWIEVVEEPLCTVAPEAVGSIRVVAAILPQTWQSIPLSEALAQTTDLILTQAKADGESSTSADAVSAPDTLQKMMHNPLATLAEQQMGTLCTVELTDGETDIPYVYDLTDGRQLTLADFLGDAMGELAAIFPIGANTPFCPTAEGLVLHLPGDEIITLVWNAFPSLGECVSRFAMDTSPLLSPEGARIIQ